MKILCQALSTAIAVLLLWCGQPIPIAVATPEQLHAYAYDSQSVATTTTYSATERGPPAPHPRDAAYDPNGLRPLGVLARPDGTMRPSGYVYDDTALLVQTDIVAATTGAPVEVIGGDLSSTQPWQVAANSGNRVFWSGGQPAKEAAESFAKANGSKTLEMTAVGRTLEKLPYNRFTAKLWDAASAGFAATARGNANVFIGPSFRGAGSTFGRVEGPILRFKGSPILQRFEDVW